MTRVPLDQVSIVPGPEGPGSQGGRVREPEPPRCVTLRDGRRVAIADYGTMVGTPVFYFHGFPASRLEGELMHGAAARQRVRLVAIDRPGFGYSDFRPHTLAEWPSDVLEVADALGLKRFGVLAVSGGAPFALACGAALAARVSAIGIVAGLGMTSVAEDLARFERFARLSFRLARSTPALSRAVNRVLAAVLQWRPELLNTLLAADMSSADRAVLADPRVGTTLAASLLEALRAGSEGASHELGLLARPWNFDVTAVRVPCYVWHGEQDTTVPVELARRLATLIPGCRATFLRDEGHFSMPLRHADAVLQMLLRHG